MIKKYAENRKSLSVVIIFKFYSFNINFLSYSWLVNNASRVHEGRVTSWDHYLCSLTRLHIQKGPEYNKYLTTCLGPEEVKYHE